MAYGWKDGQEPASIKALDSFTDAERAEYFAAVDKAEQDYLHGKRNANGYYDKVTLDQAQLLITAAENEMMLKILRRRSPLPPSMLG